MTFSAPTSHGFVRAACAIALGIGLGLVSSLSAAAAAEPCTADDFGKTVDGAGASLRAYNQEAAPKLQARLKALAGKKGWADADLEDAASAYLQDARTAQLDETANGLLAKVDTLGSLDPSKPIDCARLEELRVAGIELLAVMKAKNAYIAGKIDGELGPSPPPASVATAPVPPVAAPAPVPALKPTQAPDVRQTAVPVKPEAPTPKKPSADAPWNTTTTQAPLPPPLSQPPPADVAIALPPSNATMPRPSAPMTAPPPPVLLPDEGYSIDEIRDATRGFFGGVSTGLAAVIEHAFAKSGRPTAYILGQEGGGAFLGGLRYGDGTLYVRSGGTQRIYWHGPSVGFDFGAAGARTLVLVYKMSNPSDLYRVFTGLDGSAFVVGGVGLTLLGGGDMVLAPIRSGLGVRVGANIGYLRFTPQRTWNPF
jgi:hypothetical protein